MKQKKYEKSNHFRIRKSLLTTIFATVVRVNKTKSNQPSGDAHRGGTLLHERGHDDGTAQHNLPDDGGEGVPLERYDEAGGYGELGDSGGASPTPRTAEHGSG